MRKGQLARPTCALAYGALILALVTMPTMTHTVRADLSTGVTFIVPSGTPISQSDFVVYNGRPSGFTQATGCTRDTNFHPIQSIIIADTERATTSSTITISQTSPVPDGTRVINLVLNGPCTANGISYDRWSGVIFP